MNLKTIAYLQKNYPQHTIGYSDHTIGISAPVAAVAMGARIIEKHITLDRRMKGTDQAGSLGPDGVRRMVRDIRLTDMGMGEEEIFICEDTKAAKQKLERSIATKHAIPKGQQITIGDLHLLSPGTGFRWSDRDKVIGKKATTDLPANELVLPHMIA
jgi:sialic acid synthase